EGGGGGGGTRGIEQHGRGEPPVVAQRQQQRVDGRRVGAGQVARAGDQRAPARGANQVVAVGHDGALAVVRRPAGGRGQRRVPGQDRVAERERGAEVVDPAASVLGGVPGDRRV